MRDMSGIALFPIPFSCLRGCGRRGLRFGNATEGKQQLYEVLGSLFRSLFHNVANSVGDRSLEHHTRGLQAG
jgi:hypothetical protein